MVENGHPSLLFLGHLISEQTNWTAREKNEESPLGFFRSPSGETNSPCRFIELKTPFERLPERALVIHVKTASPI